MHNLLERFPDRPHAGEFLSRDVIVPRFLDYFMAAYASALSSSTAEEYAEADRRELRFLLARSARRRPLWRLLVLAPYQIARPAYRLGMTLPLPWSIKRLLQGMVATGSTT